MVDRLSKGAGKGSGLFSRKETDECLCQGRGSKLSSAFDCLCLGVDRFSIHSPNDITQILDRIESGDPTASSELFPLVYDELRRLANGN